MAGVSVIESDTRHESDEALAARLPDLDIERIRLVGVTAGTSLRRAANAAQVHLADQPTRATGTRGTAAPRAGAVGEYHPAPVRESSTRAVAPVSFA